MIPHRESPQIATDCRLQIVDCKTARQQDCKTGRLRGWLAKRNVAHFTYDYRVDFVGFCCRCDLLDDSQLSRFVGHAKSLFLQPPLHFPFHCCLLSSRYSYCWQLLLLTCPQSERQTTIVCPCPDCELSSQLSSYLGISVEQRAINDPLTTRANRIIFRSMIAPSSILYWP